MAESGMIQPFDPKLVRSMEFEANIIPVLSFGCSSYGYDIRLSPKEFRIFRHIPGTIVNPKRFNPENLEVGELQRDRDGEFFILPGRSYGLGVALEHLNIPENITVICLGKSTYARCFRGDTRVALVDGSSPTLEEMAQRAQQGENFWGYSIDKNGLVIITLLSNPRYIGRDSLVKVTLDNEESIFCTPDHLFMKRHGSMVPADDLRPNDSLMPLYRENTRGYETVYQPLTGVKNHKVASVQDIPGIHDVYCLTVPEAGNFAIAAGVFVHNCGIIANITPAEAGWRGHLTLEFSNSSPADARIYASEGVCQLLFLEGESCQTTYEQRKGKYQDQAEKVILPKI